MANPCDPARAHQLKIARATLKLSLGGAAVMGGMTYAAAYRLIFGISLRERIADLMQRYPRPCDLTWELGQYGYTWRDLPDLYAHACSEEDQPCAS